MKKKKKSRTENQELSMQFSKTIESASNMSNRWFAERLLSDLKSNFGRLTAAQWYWVKKIVDGDYESTPVKKNAVITKRDIQKMNQPGFMTYPHEGIVIDDDQSLPVPFLAVSQFESASNNFVPGP